uniref:Uncharacterized protein n=1 Tax=Trieres chinensis TaxID=1514140 RepID=A0A7S2EJA0_TRICV
MIRAAARSSQPRRPPTSSPSSRAAAAPCAASSRVRVRSDGSGAVRRFASEGGGGDSAAAAAAEERAQRLARLRAYNNYRKRNTLDFGFLSSLRRRLGGSGNKSSSGGDGGVHERNVKIASYAAAAVVGALGATYASVPLYKMFCQATGFGGTTQRVTLTEWAEKQEEREDSGKTGRKGMISQALYDKMISLSNVPASMLPQRGASHGRGGPKTWTDEEAAARLASLKPVKGGRLITVRFDSTVGDVLPWSFVPAQLDVKVVPGETALSFFTASNKSDRAITGVATYNVHPPRAGLYFNKIQCFCFEEQRLLPGETVDMPVFFFIDPEYADDPQLRGCNNVTLSYTFFQTDEDDEEEEDDEDEDAEEGDKALKGASGDTEGSSTLAQENGAANERRGWIKGWWPGR